MMTIHKTPNPNPNRWSLNPAHPMLFNANLFFRMLRKTLCWSVSCRQQGLSPRFRILALEGWIRRSKIRGGGKGVM